MKKLLILLILFLFFPGTTESKKKEIAIWKVLLAEAAGEGKEGMKAVYCAMRNRANLEKISIEKAFYKYCAGSRRKDLDRFVERQPKHLRKAAKKIAKGKLKDIVGGATHFENVEKFGMPYWAKKMKITKKIGHHTFFKK